MHSSRKYNFIFIHNQKTAGCSIQRYLNQSVLDARRILPMHAWAVDGIQHLGRDTWGRNYTFGFVRNPWARLVSWYSMVQEEGPRHRANPFKRYVRKNASSFEEFLTKCTETITVVNSRGVVDRRSIIRNQIDYFTDEAGEIAVNFIGRFEHLDADFGHIQRTLGLPIRCLQVINSTAKKDYRKFYTDYTYDLVARRFKMDIALFRYTFDGP